MRHLFVCETCCLGARFAVPLVYIFTTGNCAEAFVRLMILSGLWCRVGLDDVQSIVKGEICILKGIVDYL